MIVAEVLTQSHQSPRNLVSAIANEIPDPDLAAKYRETILEKNEATIVDLPISSTSLSTLLSRNSSEETSTSDRGPISDLKSITAELRGTKGVQIKDRIVRFSKLNKIRGLPELRSQKKVHC